MTEFDAFEREYWEWRLREFPELSTWTGDNRYNDRLQDMSWEAVERQRADERAMHERARAFDRQALSEQDAISLDLLLWELEQAVASHRFPPVMVLNQIWGPHLMLPQLMSVTPFRNAADYRNYVARLNAFPRYLEQAEALLLRGIETGWVQPAVPLRGVPDQIGGQLVDDAEKSILFTPFGNVAGQIGETERAELRSAALKAIQQGVLPALARFRDFVTARYLPAGDRPIAATTLPDGQAYYDQSVREHTTTDLTAAQIHEIGLKEVARIRASMEAAIGQAGFKGNLAEFVAFLRSDPRFYFSQADDLVTAYRAIAKRADAELPGLFAELPRTPYGVRAFPDYEAPSQTTAMYFPGASDGSRAGYVMVNTYKLDMRPRYEMEALTLHEGVPGHHLQIARAQEQQHLPDFRRNAGYNAYTEGWGLYAESLGTEMGFYTDPYSRFGQLTYEMWRACRLVVDTGMHQLGWSRQRAIDYVSGNTAKTEQDIAVEVDRYIVWPGQALSYKIGELKIRELRTLAERSLGERFSIRTFHNALLDDGPLPLALLEERVRKWIASHSS